MLWDAECFQSERNLDEESDFTLFAFKTNTLNRSVYTLEYTKGLIEVCLFFSIQKLQIHFTLVSVSSLQRNFGSS